MHADPLHIDINEVSRCEPIPTRTSIDKLLWLIIIAGSCIFFAYLFIDPKHLWNSYFITSVFWLGLSLGGVIITVIFQIVRATWCSPIRRIAESNVAFLPYAYLAYMGTYFGKSYLFMWATTPMPGREFWMQPDFVYGRIGVGLGLLVFLLHRFVRMSLRSDVGFLKETSTNKSFWQGHPYDQISKNWGGVNTEVKALQAKMSWNAPVIILTYVIVVSLLAFEMIMGQDNIWYSNMMGGFIFLGNIYMAWAMTALLTMYFMSVSPVFKKQLGTQQFWDLGKLTFGFSMLWGYTMISQYLPQWYGNLPEETQWLILRTKEMPWKPIAFLTLGMCFIFPFLTLVSEDIKKTPKAFGIICCVVLLGMWCEKFILVSPQRYPHELPFGLIDIVIFVTFAAVYFMSVTSFMSKYPFLTVSHPQAKGDVEW
jgi:hypothetical protein